MPIEVTRAFQLAAAAEILASLAGCLHRKEPWQRQPASYEGEVMWSSFDADKPGPRGGPAGLYHFLLEPRGKPVHPPQATVLLDSLTRIVDHTGGRGKRLGAESGFFVRVWFRGPPRSTEFETRGTAEVIVVDSIRPVRRGGPATAPK